MKCPHCLVEFHDNFKNIYIDKDANGGWGVRARRCPSCNKLIIEIIRGDWTGGPSERKLTRLASHTLVRPKSISRTPLGKEIPDPFAQDYREACLVLSDSPKASAALGRRCLQHLLRERAGVKHGNLADEIEQVLDSQQLPSYLAEAVDGVRNIGNFAAHPIKSTSTGEIVEVEPGEAEWMLDTLEGLFDFYFVQPAKLREKRDALNQKLKDAGKPEMK
jgi:hypothetical protein